MGLTLEGLAADHGRLYNDSPDMVIHGGQRIKGFLETDTEYDDDGESAASRTVKILHSPVDLNPGTTVTINGTTFTVETREETQGEFRYRLNSS